MRLIDYWDKSVNAPRYASMVRGDELADAIVRDADELARTYRIDPTRTRRVLEKTATVGDIYLLDPGTYLEEHEESGRSPVAYSPSFARALALLSPETEKAFAFFDEIVSDADLDRFVQRIDAVQRLISGFPFFLTLRELRAITRRFLAHLDANRESILRTGVPATVFAEAPWFDCFAPTLHIRDEIELARRLDGAGVGADYVQTILDMREPLFGVKLEVIRRLALALEMRLQYADGSPEGIVSGVWTGCRDLVAQLFGSTDALSTYIDAEHCLCPGGWGPLLLGLRCPVEGTISHLFLLVGHYEMEIRSTIVHRTREALSNGMPETSWPRRFSREWVEERYYRFVRDVGAQQSNAAIDRFIATREKDSAALDNSLVHHRQELLISVLPSASRWSMTPSRPQEARCAADGGTMPIASTKGAMAQSSESLYVFSQLPGGGWSIVYEGRKFCPPRDWVGLRYILYLLRRAGQDAEVGVLLEECGRLAALEVGPEQAEFAAQTARAHADSNASVTGRPQLSDAQKRASREYDHRIAQLEAEAEKIEDDAEGCPIVGKPLARLKRIKAEVGKLRKAKNSAQRSDADPATKKQADAVRKAIKDTIARLSDCGPLHGHLAASETFKFGFRVRYCPTHIPWVTT